MKPEFAIKQEIRKSDHTVLLIDSSKAKYQGMPWRSLGNFGKEKFKNILTIMKAEQNLKIIYV